MTVAVSAPDSYAYFPVVDQNDQFGVLSINTANNELGTTLELTGIELDPYSPVAVSLDGHHIYFMKLVTISNNTTGELVVASSGTSPQIVGTSGPLTLQPTQGATTPGFGLISVSPDGNTVYVADVRNNYVYGFDVSTPTSPTAYSSAGSGSQGEGSPITALAVGSSGQTNQVYIGDNNGIVSCSSTPGGLLFSCPGLQSINSVPLAIVLYGSDLYVSTNQSEVSVFDAATLPLSLIASSTTDPNYPYGLAVSSDGSKIYAANANPQQGGPYTVSEFSFNGTTLTHVGYSYTVAHGSEANSGIAITADDTTLFVPEIFGSEVSVINTADFAAMPTTINIAGSTGVTTTTSPEIGNFIGTTN